VLEPNPQEPNWQNEQNGGAANLGFFGGNHHHQNQQAHDQNMQEEEEEDIDMATDNRIEVEANDDANNQNPDPEIRHHVMDLDLSGSSMEFLRATGPDIAIDDVFQREDSSSSSSDATSRLNEEMLRFIVAQNLCAIVTHLS